MGWDTVVEVLGFDVTFDEWDQFKQIKNKKEKRLKKIG